MIKETSFKTLGPQAAKLVTTLHERGRCFFRLEDVRKITQLPAASARSFARKLVDRGVATRLKAGLFVLVPYELGKERQYMADPLLVAREILRGKKYYLSHGTAMEIHGMLIQPQLVVTTSTPLVRPPMTALGVQFRFVHCQRQHLFGLTHHWVTKQEKVCVSDLERTILDGLKTPHLCGGLIEVARGLWMRRGNIQMDRLVAYAKRLGVGAVAQRLGFLLETYDLEIRSGAASSKLLSGDVPRSGASSSRSHELGTSKHRESLLRMVRKAYVRLDPVLPAAGKFLRRWRLQLNVPMEELHAAVQT